MSHDASGDIPSGRAHADTKSLLQKAAVAVGAVFLLVGVLGFVPGITQNIYPMAFAGYEPTGQALLLGVFAFSVLHNFVHLLFGVAGVLMAKSWSGARAFLIGGGVIYLVLWLYGLIIDRDSSANFVPLNDADNWLHLVLGVGMLALGFMLSKRDREAGVSDTASR